MNFDRLCRDTKNRLPLLDIPHNNAAGSYDRGAAYYYFRQDVYTGMNGHTILNSRSPSHKGVRSQVTVMTDVGIMANIRKGAYARVVSYGYIDCDNDMSSDYTSLTYFRMHPRSCRAMNKRIETTPFI